MSRDRARIFNENRLGKYYWQTANIVDDLGLSVYAFRLYGHLVRIASIENVDVATRALALACKMSTGKVSDAKAELVKAGLISAQKKPSGRGKFYDEIHILDVAARNVQHCEKRVVSSPHELISSPDELASSPHEHLFNNQQPTTSAATASHAQPVVIPANELTNADIATHEMDIKHTDPLTHAFERVLTQHTPEKTIQQWRGAQAAKDMCAVFAKVFAADVGKGDAKKWLAGASRLVELGATQVELVAARDAAAKIDAVLTHPGAAYEWVKGVRARAKANRPTAPITAADQQAAPTMRPPLRFEEQPDGSMLPIYADEVKA